MKFLLDMGLARSTVDFLRRQGYDAVHLREQGLQLPDYRELDGRVLKALYLLQAVPWIAVTADTLAHALLRDVRTENAGTLRDEIEDSLKHLQAARYVVPKGDGVWEFLTGAKKSFEEEVAGVTVRQFERRRAARTALRVALTNGTIVWNGRAEELDGRTTTLNPIFNRHVAQTVPYVYPKFDLAAVKPNEDEIKATLTVAPYALPTVGAALDIFGQDGHLNQHSAVVEEVRRELERRSHRGQDLGGKALEEFFTGGDYGWHPVIVRLVLAAMFRAGMVSVKAENVHYTDPSVPAAQVLLTQVRPFRRTVFFYEAIESHASLTRPSRQDIPGKAGGGAGLAG